MTERETRGIGGSDAPVICRLSPFKSPATLFAEMRGLIPRSEEETEAMLWGQLLEDDIAEVYAIKTGRKIRRQPTRFSSKYPWMRVSMDRQIVNDPRGPGILECKNMNGFQYGHVRTEEDCPDHIYIQGQHYLAGTGYAWCSFAILIGGNRFVYFDVERDEQTIEMLVEIEKDFLDRVERNEPPGELIYSDDMLKRLYPKETGEVITLDTPEALFAAQHLQEFKTKLADLEELKKIYEARLKMWIGNAAVAEIPGFGQITWKNTKATVKAELDQEKVRREFPEAYEACVVSKTTGGYRRFLLKPDKEQHGAATVTQQTEPPAIESGQCYAGVAGEAAGSLCDDRTSAHERGSQPA